MIIHTTKISTAGGLRKILQDTTTGAWLDRCNPRGSRSHAFSFDIALESDGSPDQHGTARKHRRNVGTAERKDWGAGFAASWADWGHFLAALFELDPSAKAGPYTGREDFHVQTRGEFLADDTAELFTIVGVGSYDAATDTLQTVEA